MSKTHKTRRKTLGVLVSCLGLGLSVHCFSHGEGHNTGTRADSHAPIGVMGDHMHKEGEFMLSFRHMTMNMSGNVQGSDDISNEEIVTTVANNTTAAPPTLRIVPQDMTVDMQMLGMMYAPSDYVTLMAMINYVTRDMRLTTFQGASGTTELGDFNTKSSGLGDTKLGLLLAGPQSGYHKVHFNFGLSVPTGSIDETDTILTPMGTTPEVRLPYTMQLGTGTHDLTLGVTYNGHSLTNSWGVQYLGTARLGTNDAGYSWGDEHNARAWWQYLWNPAFSSGLNLHHKVSEDIFGNDENIAGPVQTADPINYGGDRTSVGLSFNYLGQAGVLEGHRFALEYSATVNEDLNGVQMSMDDMWTVGYQYAF